MGDLSAHSLLTPLLLTHLCLFRQLNLSDCHLCGVWTKDGSQYGNYTAEGITAIVDALRVNGGLTKISLARNKLGEKSTKVICEALKQNKTLKELDLSGCKRHNESNIGGAAGANHVADMLGVNGGLTKLSLAQNMLKDEGTKAICEALEQNKTLKELDISGGKYEGNIGGSAGAKHVAKMLGVNGGLTVANLLGNRLDTETAKMLAEVAKQKGISLCGIRRDQTTADFRNQGLGPPDAILLASDLSQAVVTGALTMANLLGNRLDTETAKMLAEVAKQKGISLCGIRRDQTTADFRNQLGLPDAILLASDLSQAVVTGGLTALDLYYNDLKDEGISAVCEAIQSNKETKLASLNFNSNCIGPVGANAVAAMVAVTGALTEVR
jgi:Ran GTPase-activating protein (RanGAP) involved in mRNA processing and transport